MNKHINKIKFVFGLLAVVGFAGVVPTPVQAETTQCTVISSLPYTISVQGVYCLKGNLGTAMTSGSAITINTNNVTIDLNGYKIGGLAAGAGTQAYGIYASQKQNITIRNGIIRGFMVGIFFQADATFSVSQGHLIESIRADQNTFQAIFIKGRGSTIRNCQVVSTGGTTAPLTYGYAWGITAYGPGNSISNNSVTDTVEQSGGTAYGIYVANAGGDKIESNHVTNTSIGPGISYGVYVNNSPAVSVMDNNIVNFGNGIAYAGGIVGLYRDNLVSGATTAFYGGTAAGTTNYSIP